MTKMCTLSVNLCHDYVKASAGVWTPAGESKGAAPLTRRRQETPALVQRIAGEFASFRDESTWRGMPVRFFKRAQICVADLARMLPGHALGRLRRLEHLTAFADYKVPQVMRKAGILVLSDRVAERIGRGGELAPGSEEEVELRAATIWGCEWTVRALARDTPSGSPAPSATEVDYLLWSAGQDKRGLPPYHLTRTDSTRMPALRITWGTL